MILVIDNYDSFVFNLVQMIADKKEVKVFRNDEITLAQIKALNPEAIIISPGPCTPLEAGISVSVIKEFAPTTPILGICLGHQAIAFAFGGKIVKASRIVHGKTSRIFHDGEAIFRNVENPFTATRYHSLVVEKSSLPRCLRITAWTGDGLIMGLRHHHYKIEGLQFHPESILTSEGKKIVENFLTLYLTRSPLQSEGIGKL